MCDCLLLSLAICWSFLLRFKFRMPLLIDIDVLCGDGSGIELFNLKNCEDVDDLALPLMEFCICIELTDGVVVLEFNELFDETDEIGMRVCCCLNRSGVMFFVLKFKIRISSGR